MKDFKDETLEMMEPGAALTDAQLHRLDTDAELLEDCEHVFMASHLLSMEQGKVDVDAALASFHGMHGERLSPEGDHPVRNRNSLFKYLLAAAAVALAIILIAWPRQEEKNDEFFAQERLTEQISITTSDGNSVPVSVSASSNKIDKKMVVAAIGGEEEHIVSVPYGKSLELVLPDSTQVFLHPGSELVYSGLYGKEARNVKLKGEAYFVVTKNARCPFVVTTAKSQTTVFGTEFDVTSYADMPERVTLVTGSVAVRMQSSEKQLEIVPGQQVSLSRMGYVRVESVDVDPYTSWRDGFFYYDNMELGDILKELSRSYNVSVECHEPQLLGYHMRFIIPRNKDIHYVIEMINRMQKVKASLSGNTVVISRD